MIHYIQLQTLDNESEKTPLSIEKVYGDEIFFSRKEEDRIIEVIPVNPPVKTSQNTFQKGTVVSIRYFVRSIMFHFSKIR